MYRTKPNALRRGLTWRDPRGLSREMPLKPSKWVYSVQTEMRCFSEYTHTLKAKKWDKGGKEPSTREIGEEGNRSKGKIISREEKGPVSNSREMPSKTDTEKNPGGFIERRSLYAQGNGAGRDGLVLW